MPGSAEQSNRLGDFVAAGMGMVRATNIPAATLTSDEMTVLPLRDTLSLSVTAAALTGTSASTKPALGNYNLSSTSDCWQQWTEYWSVNAQAVTLSLSYSTLTKTYTIIQYGYSFSNGFSPESITTTVYNGAHPQTTFTTVTSVPIPLGGTSWPTTTWTRIDTISDAATFNATTQTAPSCSLPSYVPACQSSWDEWFHYNYADMSSHTTPVEVSCTQTLSVGSPALSCPTPPATIPWKSLQFPMWLASPSCTQAKLTGSACSTMIDQLLSATQDPGRVIDGVMMHAMTVSSYTTRLGITDRATTVMTTSWFWDPSHEFAPGCTLGCQSCQINGGTVQLLYWPPQSSLKGNGSHSATPGKGSVSTLVTLGTTLTSPTLYVSFDSLYARDSCSVFGKTRTNQIIAITNTASLSSLYGWNSNNGLQASASFNLTDL